MGRPLTMHRGRPPSAAQPAAASSTAEVAGFAAQVLDEVGHAVVGKRDVLSLVLAAILAKGHVLLEDFPGLGKTLAARSFAQAPGPGLLPRAVHPRPAAGRPHRLLRLRPAPRRVRLPPRAALRRPAARRRDQPHPAEDPGGAARGDAGGPGHRRGRDAPAAAPLPRAGHRQPGRVRGHLPAARGPARPLPAAGRLRLPDRRTRSTTCCARRIVRRREEVVVEPVTDAARPRRPAGGGGAGPGRRVGRRATAWRSPRPPAPIPRRSPGPRRAAASAWCWRRAAWALVRGRDYVVPEDVKSVARAVLGHRVTVRPELWMTAASGPGVVDSVLSTVPTPQTLERAPERALGRR